MKLLSSGDIEKIYQPLFSIGAMGPSPEDGFFRPSWSEEEEMAFNSIKEMAVSLGLQPRYDEVGNLFLEQAGFKEYVECGSHLDTVLKGGNYDGAAGIVAGLAAIQTILQSGLPLKRGLRLRIWRGEESTAFYFGCKGSRAAFGCLSKSALEKSFRSQTLAEAISQLGYRSNAIQNGSPTISREEIEGIHAHLELHIEQANSLEQQNVDIGVVTSIRAPSRWMVFLQGRFDHSGGTPMGAKFRRDANLALSYIAVALDKLCQEALAAGNDLVQTMGVINSDSQANQQHPEVLQNAIAKVSGYAYFSLDIRSCQKIFREQYLKSAFSEVQKVAADFGVEVRIEKVSESDPCESMDAEIRRVEFSAAKKLGYSVVELPSGAVHDCLYVSEQKKSDGRTVPIGMVFIPCRDGISHAPEEYSSFEAVAKGANVLAHSLYELAKE